MRVVGRATREALSALAVVARNGRLRTLNTAVLGSMVGDWAMGTAIIVWAYGAGGAFLLGVWGAIRIVVLAIATPFASEWMSHHRPRRVMVWTDLARAMLILVAAGIIASEGPIALVLALALVTQLLGSAYRDAQAMLTTALVGSPTELTSVTRVWVMLESWAFIVGPLVAALLLTVADVEAVYALRAASLVWSAVLIARISTTSADRPGGLGAPSDEKGAANSRLGLKRSLSGFAVIRRDTALMVLTTIFCGQCMLAGASMVFVAVFAFDITGLGASGVGYLDAIVGLGAQVGVLLGIVLGARRRLATDFGLGAVLWALALLTVAAWPTPAAAFTTMALIGIANPIVDTNASIVLRRITPEVVRGRTMAALETALLASMALGALAMPILIDTVGLRWGLIVLAVPSAVIAIAGLPWLRRLDQTLPDESSATMLLGSIPLFQPLPQSLKESLSGQLSREDVAAGTVVLREGDLGTHFFLIETGSVEARNSRGTIAARMSAGDCFGEIALLHDVPRTLTVVAVQDTVLHRLSRSDFLTAVTSYPGLGERVDVLAADRLRRS